MFKQTGKGGEAAFPPSSSAIASKKKWPRRSPRAPSLPGGDEGISIVGW